MAQKVRDTVAGLVGAARNESNNLKPSVLAEAGRLLVDRRQEVRVALWLEDDAAVDARTWKQELDTLTEKIKKYLSWLTPRVLIISLRVTPHKLDGVTVSNTSAKQIAS